MLRAAGIPAYVALLNVESRSDVPVDLPGMGMFDHAIVYVPGKNPIWIDATDRYAQLGQVPMGDQSRLALITSDATTALARIPEAPSHDNGLVETREFKLTDNGPANVVEITQPEGILESGYRGYYADKPDKDTREGLRGYIKADIFATISPRSSAPILPISHGRFSSPLLAKKRSVDLRSSKAHKPPSASIGSSSSCPTSSKKKTIPTRRRITVPISRNRRAPKTGG